MGVGRSAPVGARGCAGYSCYSCCKVVSSPNFEDGEWVMVRRNGNRVGKKTLGRVVKSWPTTVSGVGSDWESDYLVYQYEIRWHAESTQGRDCSEPQNEGWLSPAAPPPAASAVSAGAGDASSEAKAAQGARLSGLEAQQPEPEPEQETEPEPQARPEAEEERTSAAQSAEEQEAVIDWAEKQRAVCPTVPPVEPEPEPEPEPEEEVEEVLDVADVTLAAKPYM